MSSFLEYHMLQEARKNPDQNPKVPAIKIIQAEYDDAPVLDPKMSDIVHNCFVSFTALDKLGVNPTSRYDTPIGCYSYPADLFVDKYESKDVPFAGNSKYINVFKAKNPKKVVILNEMGHMRYKELIENLREVYLKMKFEQVGELTPAMKEMYWKKFVDRYESWLNDAPSKAYVNSMGGYFWYMSREVANDVGRGKEIQHNLKGHEQKYGPNITRASAAPIPVTWNKVFREMDIDGFVDTGEGIIHSAEKQQAVFTSAAAIEVISRIENKEYKDQVIPRENRTKIVGYLYEALAENDSKKFVSLIKKILGDSKNPSKITPLYRELINVILLRMGSGSIESAVDAVNKLKLIIDITRTFNIDDNDYTYDLVTERIRKARTDINTNWPVLYFMLPGKYNVYSSEEYGGGIGIEYLDKMLYFFGELYDSPVAKLYEVIDFCKAMKIEWWNDTAFEGVVNKWDEKFPRIWDYLEGKKTAAQDHENQKEIDPVKWATWILSSAFHKSIEADSYDLYKLEELLEKNPWYIINGIDKEKYLVALQDIIKVYVHHGADAKAWVELLNEIDLSLRSVYKRLHGSNQ